MKSGAKLGGVFDKLMTHLWLLFEGAAGLLVGLEAGDVEVVVVAVVVELVVVVSPVAVVEEMAC